VPVTEFYPSSRDNIAALVLPQAGASCFQVANSLPTCTVELTPMWLASRGCCGPFVPANQNIGFLALHMALGKLISFISCPYSFLFIA